MKKFAYMVLSHKLDYTLKTLLTLLDDTRNDIFIHVDQKTKDFAPEALENNIKHANVYFVPRRINVQWGAWSLIQAELELLKLAVSCGTYDYYHLISGEDLPLKTQEDIYLFFEKNYGKQFINFQDSVFRWGERVRYYYFFQELIGRSCKYATLEKLNNRMLLMQYKANIHRNKGIDFQKGAEWFSITQDLAEYVLSKRKWIEKVFKNTLCCDEVFLQTIVHNSPFKTQLYHTEYDDSQEAMMRLIDWDRGTPYVFQSCDKEQLLNSPMIFARKFDCEVDKDIIGFLKEYLLNEKG